MCEAKISTGTRVRRGVASLPGPPYDLRHAFVSTMLNAGISPAQVAEWAGQSPEVMWRIYAGCLDGGQEQLRRRIEAAYG